MTDTTKDNSTANSSDDTSTDKSAAEMAKETKDAAKDRALELKARARQDAERLYSESKARAKATAEHYQGAAASEADATAQAFRDAGDHFDDNDFRRQATTQIANGIGAVADSIREKDLSEIPGELRRFARRNPLMFYAGGALLGFAATRLATASDRRVHTDFDDADWEQPRSANEHIASRGYTPAATQASPVAAPHVQNGADRTAPYSNGEAK